MNRSVARSTRRGIGAEADRPVDSREDHGLTRRGYLGLAAGGAAWGLTGLAAAACGPLAGREAAPGGPGTAAKAPVTLDYWTFWNEERLSVVRPEMPKLEAKLPHLKVNVTFQGEFRDKLRSVVAAGTPPDTSISEAFSAAVMFDNGNILDLRPYLARDKINLKKDWVLSGYEEWCGKNYVFPLTGWSYAIAYSKNLFRKAGLPDLWTDRQGKWTWDDLTQFATRLTEGRDAEGMPEVFGFMVDGHSVYRGYHPFIAANGGEVFDYEKMRYTLDHPKTIEALEWLGEMHRRKIFRPSNYRQLFEGDAFNVGRLGLVGDPNYRSRPGVMKTLTFDWDLVMYPSRTKGSPQYANAFGDHNWVLKATKHPEEAYEVVKFLGMDDVQGALGRERPVQPAKQSVRHDKTTFLKAPPEHMQVFNDIWDSGYYRAPVIFQHNDLETLRKIDEIVVPAVGAGQGSIRDACLEANRQANLLVKYGNKCFQPPWKRR